MEHGVLQGNAARMNRPARVSLAIPVYNEEAVVAELVRRTTAALDQLPEGPHEIVLVDDGSSDRTLELWNRPRIGTHGSLLCRFHETSATRRLWEPPWIWFPAM